MAGDRANHLSLSIFTLLPNELRQHSAGCRQRLERPLHYIRHACLPGAVRQEAEDLCCHPFGHHAASAAFGVLDSLGTWNSTSESVQGLFTVSGRAVSCPPHLAPSPLHRHGLHHHHRCYL